MDLVVMDTVRHEARLVKGGLAVGEHDVSILQSIERCYLGT
jgi:hypothetical protein